MLDFTAIDFETANSYRGSPCSVGLVKVRGGVIVDERHWLIRPPEAADWFAPFNVSIHGITAEMVESAPRWRQILPSLLDFVGADVLVAHNAGFDIGVMRYACAADGIEWPTVSFLCTLVLGRRAYRLPSYRLPFVAEACGATLIDHHDALADARAVAGVVVGLARAAEASTLEDLAKAHRVVIGRMECGTYRGSVHVSQGGSSRLLRPETNADADPEGYLYGRVVVFTGALMSMTRQLAWEAVAKAGGLPEPNTTKRTNVLVLGDFNPAALRPGAAYSGKAQKAFDLQDKGQDIELMTEADFLEILDGGDLLIISPEKLTPNIPSPVAAPTATFRPLTRPKRPTVQPCAAPGCENTAAFKTRSKPTWCDDHITAILRAGGLEPVEPFTNPDDWRLTRCLNCGCVAHYRLEYTLQKLDEGEPTCRACFWRDWAAKVREAHEKAGVLYPVLDLAALARDAAQLGFDYLQPLTEPPREHDPHLIQCQTCGKRSACRNHDIFCSCHKK